MKKVISFLIFVIVFALLISCRSNRTCFSSTNDKKDSNSPTEVALVETEVA